MSRLGVGDLLKQVPATETQQFLLESQGGIYRSAKHEPLGRSYVRGHNVPQNVAFGRTSSAPEGVKEIFSAQPAPISRDLLSSQQSVDAEHEITKPVRRNYNWQSADPTETRFGRPSNPLANRTAIGVATALQYEGEGDEAPTRVISERQERFRLSRGTPDVGRGTLPRLNTICLYDCSIHYSLFNREQVAKLPANHTFGVHSTADSLSVKDLIAHPAAAEDDPGLGVSRLKRQAHTQLPPETQNRVFGTPSVRVDLSAPQRRSVASDVAFGDEPLGSKLIFPSKYAVRGVDDEDFLLPRAPEEVRAIAAVALNINVDDQTFAELVEAAQSIGGGYLSVDSFRHAWNRWMEHQQRLAQTQNQQRLNLAPIRRR